MTIAELARMVGRMTNAEVRFPSASAEIAGAPEEVGLDLSRVESEFGKRDYVGLEEGMQKTIDWQRALYC